MATPESRFPLGSVTKTWTTVAALRLHEAGKLELDRPVHEILDPWLQGQGLPTLQVLWRGDRTIARVTTRQLLGMASGVQDYPDLALQNFSYLRPSSHCKLGQLTQHCPSFAHASPLHHRHQFDTEAIVNALYSYDISEDSFCLRADQRVTVV